MNSLFSLGDRVSHVVMFCSPRYNALDRREASKGGKEASKKAAPSQSSTKGSTAAAKSQSSHNARRNEVSSANPSNLMVKISRPTSTGGPAYDEQVPSQCRKRTFGLVLK